MFKSEMLNTMYKGFSMQNTKALKCEETVISDNLYDTYVGSAIQTLNESLLNQKHKYLSILYGQIFFKKSFIMHSIDPNIFF